MHPLPSHLCLFDDVEEKDVSIGSKITSMVPFFVDELTWMIQNLRGTVVRATNPDRLVGKGCPHTNGTLVNGKDHFHQVNGDQWITKKFLLKIKQVN